MSKCLKSKENILKGDYKPLDTLIRCESTSYLNVDKYKMKKAGGPEILRAYHRDEQYK